MPETTATDRNIEIKVELHAAAIYWYFLKALTSFPSLPLLLGPISVVAYYEAQAGQGFYNSIGLGVFMFVLMPWGFIFLGYRNTLLKFPVRHIF